VIFHDHIQFFEFCSDSCSESGTAVREKEVSLQEIGSEFEYKFIV